MGYDTRLQEEYLERMGCSMENIIPYLEVIAAVRKNEMILDGYIKDKNIKALDVIPYHTLGVSKYEALGLESMVIIENEKVLAFTLASRMSDSVFDVHFEKAAPDMEGAYPVINCEFARYLRKKYPTLQYLNREDDLGLEGLRKAKLSYNPHHLVEKCWACLLEDGYDY